MRQTEKVKKKLMNDLPGSIESSRITIRRYQQGDGLAVYSLIKFNRARLEDSFPKTTAFITNDERGELYVHRKIREWRDQKSFYFGVWHNQTNEYIGQVFLRNINWDIPRAELGYYIDKAHEGNGFMKEAIRSLIIFGYEKLKVNKLFIRVLSSNAQSSSLAETCGFTKEGLLRNDFVKKNGSLSDSIYYGLTRDDYQVLKQSMQISNVTFKDVHADADQEIRAILQEKQRKPQYAK
jgi:[ribosomal protein S5]-alanine N-acetyltransferase